MTDKFVPIEKMNKKQRQALYSSKRKTWGSINPVTRRSEDKNYYKRKKEDLRATEEQL